MDPILGVGVPRAGTAGGFDFWLPVYMLLAFVVIRTVAGGRLSIATAVLAFVGGTAWAWVADTTGVVPAAGTAVLVAFAMGGLGRKLGYLRPRG